MYPGNYNIEWHGFKGGEPVEDAPKVGCVARAWQWREMGINPPNQPPNKTVLENIAEDILVQKPLQITSCDLPGYPRSTFLMVFSPDGTKLASTHGNHNIYVSELASGKHVRILKGHPRTPWCIAFHPSHPQLIGSGCLGGQVRVWDIASGGSEVWNVYNETVIASIAFHPREQLLVIATYNELYFWDWSQPAPFTKVSTKNVNEKVRYVAFDSLGFKLITGISLWACSGNANGSPLASQNGPPNSSAGGNSGGPGNYPEDYDNGPEDPREGPSRDFDGRPIDTPAAAQDMIVSSYQTLVQRYDSLVRNYQRLFMVRHRLINTPLANTIDRGTDPMESYPPESGRHRRRSARRSPRSAAPNNPASPTPGTSRQHEAVNHVIGTPPAPPDPNVVNLEEFSYDPVAVRTDTSATSLQPPVFRSITSAFQPLSEERANSRMLPNPFSSTTTTPLQPNSSRTSGMYRGGSESALTALRLFSIRRRNLDAAETAARERELQARNAAYSGSTVPRDVPMPSAPTDPYIPPPLPTEPPPSRPPPPPEPAPIPSTSGTRITNQLDTEANTINESLDLIRDILRDSGTRLLNLITNMSINILTNSERDENARVPPHVFSGNLTRDFMASSSDSESEHTEVNITRTPNTTFREETDTSEGTDPTAERPQNVPQVSGRMTFELDPMQANPFRDRINVTSDSDGGINVSMWNDRFRVRTQGSWAAADTSTASSSSIPTTMPVPSTPPVLSATPIHPATPVPFTTHAPSITPIFVTAPITSTSSTAATVSEASTAPTPRILSPVPSTSAATEPRPGPSSAPDGFDPNVPSTSSEGSRSGLRAPEISAAEAFRRVQLGVDALQMHTVQLANMWLRGDRTTMRELRTMWEDLRRRILTLHKEAGGRSDTPSFYTRSLLERCMILTELTEVSDLSGRRRRNARGGDTQNTTRSEGTQNPGSNRDGNQTAARNQESITPSGEGNVRNGAGNPILRCFQLATAEEMTAENVEQIRNVRNTEERQTAAANATSSQSSRGENRSNTEIRQTATNAGSQSTSRNEASTSSNPSTSTSRPSTSAGNANDRTSGAARAHRIQRNKRLVRLQHAYRWRAEDESQRRARNAPRLRISQLRATHRFGLMRTVEQNATRHVIRTRAMKVLSAMFNMMMICIEEPGLSQLIINMLKTLKKALALTCFMMMSNRNTPRRGANPPASQSVESADVVRIQNVEHFGPVNVDDEDPQSRTIDPVNETNEANNDIQASTSTTQATPIEELPSPIPNLTSQSWSQRLAVQIAAANRNHSTTANSRRDLYLETRREKALHRTNPKAHPYIRKRLPPVSSHRIPAMRTLPPGRYQKIPPRTPPDPVAGPSNAPDHNDPPNMPSDDRDNFIRLAHIRLRTAARNRFRRLQTIRLYTPSTVREMFALQDFQQDRDRDRDTREGREEENDGPGVGQAQREQFAAMLAREGVGVLQMQVNEPPAAEHGPQRLPRIHEYLQPIILAQNAMVVDDDDANAPGPPGGPAGNRRFGMAGLLDAGIISETLPAPSHRVQAWDFTSGAAPQIADNTKNVVVQRCRIHNDASIDISKDGRLLVALLPVPRLRNTNNWLGVYSLEWPRLGQCLHTAVLEQSAVSVALSPTARYLAVGLGSRRFTSSHSRTNIIALLYKLDPLESSSRTGLSPMKELEQYWEHGFTSLNCLRWAPQPGQGLVYANNTGQLIIMS